MSGPDQLASSPLRLRRTNATPPPNASRARVAGSGMPSVEVMLRDFPKLPLTDAIKRFHQALRVRLADVMVKQVRQLVSLVHAAPFIERSYRHRRYPKGLSLRTPRALRDIALRAHRPGGNGSSLPGDDSSPFEAVG